MYRFIIADMRPWVQVALCDLILDTYATADLRTAYTASNLLDAYAHHGADFIILSHTLFSERVHDTLMAQCGINHAVPVIVFAADIAVGDALEQSDTLRFVDNPFQYKQLATMIAEMLDAAQKELLASEIEEYTNCFLPLHRPVGVLYS